MAAFVTIRSIRSQGQRLRQLGSGFAQTFATNSLQKFEKNMTAITAPTIKLKTKVPAKSIALPVEHGAWGFLFEPALAGLIIAPSPAAPFILLLFVGAFLARQPVKFLIGDLQQGRRLPRTALAIRFAAMYGGIALIGFVGMLLTAPTYALFPLAVVTPLVVYLIAQDVSRRSRGLLPELTGAMALALSITVFALADGWDYAVAFVLWILMVARLIPSVLYVRSRLRIEKGKDYSVAAPISAHALALVAVVGLYLMGPASLLTALMATFLLGRSVYGLSRYRQILKAKTIGIWEVVYGVLFALSIVLGHYMRI